MPVGHHSSRLASVALLAGFTLLGMLAFVIAAASGTASLTAELSAESCPVDRTTQGIPEPLLPIFAGAAQQFALGPDGWAYLAAINAIESRFDDTALPGVASGANAFGAAGPMQIGIGGAAGDTWPRVEVAGVPGGASPPSVYDEADAVYAAANLLRDDGAPGDWEEAIDAYNHAGWYVAEVSRLASGYATSAAGGSASSYAAADAGGSSLIATGEGCDSSEPATVTDGPTASVLADGEAAIPVGAPQAVQEMLAAGNRIIDELYSYGGGHSPASMGDPPDPAADPGEEENGGPGYDCSSAVSYVLWGAGLGMSLLGGAVPASEGLATVGLPGPGRWVTIYAGESGGQAHAFIDVDGAVLDTAHLEQATPSGTGPRWLSAAEVRLELASGSFTARHPPGL